MPAASAAFGPLSEPHEAVEVAVAEQVAAAGVVAEALAVAQAVALPDPPPGAVANDFQAIALSDPAHWRLALLSPPPASTPARPERDIGEN